MPVVARASTRAQLALAVAALLVAAPPFTARAAAPRTSSLGWTRLPGAESCPSGRELALDVEARLGHTAFVAPSTAELTLEGRVEVAPAPSAFRATIRLLDRDGMVLGTRELETADPTCRDLADPLGLAIALMIDPESAIAEPTRAPAPERRAQAAAPWVGAPQLDDPGGEEPSPTEKSPWRLQADGGVTTAIGLLPRVATGARLRLLLDPEGFPALEIVGAHFPAVSSGASYSVSYAGPGVCPLTPDLQIVRLTACAGVSFGAFRASGSLGSRTDPLAQPFATAGVGRRIVGPLVGTFDASFLVPINSHVYSYDPDFHMSNVAGALDLGLGIEVP